MNMKTRWSIRNEKGCQNELMRWGVGSNLKNYWEVSLCEKYPHRESIVNPPVRTFLFCIMQLDQGGQVMNGT
jgi:hypothetical protein